MNEVPESMPSDIALLHAFLNTLDLRSFARHGTPHRGGDRLSSPAGLSEWLCEQSLTDAGILADAKDLERARRLRAQLRACVTPSVPAEPPGTVQPGIRLDVRLNSAPGHVAELAPVRADVDGALTRIALCAVRASHSGALARLKVCQAPDCQWVFYDRSRPGRGRWCAPELCGNRMKTKAYRQRRR